MICAPACAESERGIRFRVNDEIAVMSRHCLGQIEVDQAVDKLIKRST
jgi:hypothetical protein